MTVKTKKILIIGGGSAGWMTASILIKLFPNKDISLVESENVPTIGVGESTLASINTFLKILEINEKEFMIATDASYKMSIKFNEFDQIGSEGFHYPFGKPFLEDTVLGLKDWFYKKAFHENIPVQDFVRSFFPASFLFENNKFSNNEDGKYNNFNPLNDVAYHFDAIKFANWLKESYAKPKGVKHIIDDVIKVNKNDLGIESIETLKNKKYDADLYIDCTGFKSLLIGKEFQQNFESIDEILPNNRAWGVRLPYLDKEKEMQGFTNCTALGHGWVWNTPTWDRIGTGYVYSDKYISPEKSLEEFKNHLSSDKMVCKRTYKDIDKLEFRDIKFRAGIYEKTWIKNVVAIGLSAGFIEPLESNGLYSIHEFLIKLCKFLYQDEINQWDIDCYNTSTKSMFYNMVEFIALHYALSKRTDTKYWKDISEKTYSKKMVDRIPEMSVGFFDLMDRKMFSHNLDEIAGISYVSTGMNFLVLDKMDLIVNQEIDNTDYYEIFKQSFNNFEIKKMVWHENSKNELSLYSFQKKYIYGEK